MGAVVVVGVIFAVLFGAVYFSKRRFGLLGLALAAGAMLSSLWTAELTPLVEQVGVDLVAPPLETVVAATLTLFPALLLLGTGPKVSGTLPRVVASASFVLLALALLLGPIGAGFVITGQALVAYNFLEEYRFAIVTAALVYALYDIITYKPPKLDGKKSKH